MLSIYFALKLPLSFAFLSACWDCYQQHTEGWLLSQRLSWHPQPRPTQWQSACDSSWDVIAHTADTRENLWNEIPGFSIPLLRLSTAEQLRAQRVREQKAARRGCLLLLSSNTNPECHLFLSYSQWPEMQWGGYQHEFCTAVLTTACTQLVCTASNSLLKKKISWDTTTATAEEPNWMEEVQLTNHRTLLIWNLHFIFLNPCVLNARTPHEKEGISQSLSHPAAPMKPLRGVWEAARLVHSVLLSLTHRTEPCTGMDRTLLIWSCHGIRFHFSNSLSFPNAYLIWERSISHLEIKPLLGQLASRVKPLDYCNQIFLTLNAVKTQFKNNRNYPGSHY